MPRIALVLSLALHAALGMWVKVRGLDVSTTRPVVDSWQGEGIEVDALASETRAAIAAPTPVAAVAAPEAPATAVPSSREVRRLVAKSPPARSASTEGTLTPRPHAASAATKNVASPADDAASSSNAPSGATSTTTAAFGAAGLPSGVRHLPKAFTRALGLASRGDPRWLALPPGTVGEARFHLAVDEEGRLGELEFDDAATRARLSPVVEHLLENTRLLLLSGRFSLDAASVRAGSQGLKVRVEITEARADVDSDADPTGLNELEYEAPRAGRPGHGSFRLNSGRRVIGWVYLD
ncbi:MAG TPA: hypothetical protein VGQ57_16815 [Polyangiaceae bacterium]|nr:hypothetical protein [Polyangiaceae bacterium]